MLASLDMNLLLTFEAILDARSVSLAAERLGVRQPAVSAALARLRRIFGDELFVRAAGAMQPTPRALRLAGNVAIALAELRSAMIDVPWVPTIAERSFMIASTDYTTLVLLPAVMAAIEREAPGVDLRVIGYDKGDIPDLIDRGEIDIALGVFPNPPERAVRQVLFPERFVGLARVGHPRLVGGTMSLEAYVSAAHALVSLRRDATGEIDAVLARCGLARRVAFTVSHMLALPPILERTDLITAVPSRMADAVIGPQLQAFNLPIDVKPWRIEMLWNPNARSDRGSAWLRAQISAAASATSIAVL